MPITTNNRPARRTDRNTLRELLRGAGEQLYLAAQEWPEADLGPFPADLAAARVAIRTARERLELDALLAGLKLESSDAA